MTKLAEREERLVRVEHELAVMQQRDRQHDRGNPWIRMQGSLPDDELTEEWRQAMDSYRRQQDEQAAEE